MKHISTILDIVETGIDGDTLKCREYVELWLEQLRKDGEYIRLILELQNILQGNKGQLLYSSSTEREEI